MQLKLLLNVTAISIIGLVILTSLALLIYFIVAYQRKVNKSQQKYLDVDLLDLIDKQVDGMITSRRLADSTPLTKSEATIRLSSLSNHGLVKLNYTTAMKGFYRLRTPIDRREPPELSEEPFLTVQDILVLFKHYDYNPSLQNMVMATRLPVKVIMREMKYFQKEGVIQILYGSTDAFGTTPASRSFVLQEPYRSDPDRFLEREAEFNLDIRRALVKDSLLV